MERFLKKMIVLCLLLLLSAVAMDGLFTRVFREGDNVRTQWLAKKNGEHFDTVILGSSRAWWNLNMGLIQEHCDRRVIDIANNHFTPSEILLSFKMFLANGNTVDQVLLQVDHKNLSANQQELSSAVPEFLPWLEEEVVGKHLMARAKEWRLLRLVPFARYARYNFKWGPEQLITTLADTRPPLFDSLGSYFIAVPFRGEEKFVYRMTEYEFNSQFQEIADLCRERNIGLHLFVAPYYNLSTPPRTLAAFQKTLHETGLPMTDHSNLLEESKYFIDNTHLNPEGGRLFTLDLIEKVICPANGNTSGQDHGI